MADPNEGAEFDVAALNEWQQGDYTTDCKDFFFADGRTEDGQHFDIAGDTTVKGLVVVTQTCDIVNMTKGKEHVVLCPLVELTQDGMKAVVSGRSPFAATLEHPPQESAVVDLGRMLTIHKSVLASLTRQSGFSSDRKRVAFSEALERKHGRFAFPDDFSIHVLAKLRERLLDSHGKENSDNGKAYRSIATARAQATPSWEGEDVTVTFFFILEEEGRREADLAAIARTLDDHLAKIKWPRRFRPAAPPYHLEDIETMTAAQWVTSQPIDWDFISAVARQNRWN